MEKSSVEKAFQIYSPEGMAEGEFRWTGKELFFFPLVPWKPGIRYTLRLSGTVFAEDGRELPLSSDIPFYAVSRSSLPYIQSFSPADGASTSPLEPLILELNFSLPMDRRAAEDAIRLNISGNKVFEWLDDDKTLRVTSDKPLDPWTLYNWSISEKAFEKNGAPLAREYSGSFITDLNRDFIKVLKVVPLIPPKDSSTVPANDSLWGTWACVGISMEQGLGHGQGIGIELSKPVESESLRRAFSFDPPLPGRVEILSPVSAVFIPSKDTEPETVYSLRISGNIRDLDGLKMGEDFSTSFNSDIYWFKIISVSCGNKNEKTVPASGAIFSTPVNSEGIVRCYIRFSFSVDPAVREEIAFKISLRPFFPKTLPPVSLSSAMWFSSDILVLEWDGLEGGSSGKPNYYKLFIPGGQGGARNGAGAYLKEDFYLYMEVENE
jgi:hypothetical protein